MTSRKFQRLLPGSSRRNRVLSGLAILMATLGTAAAAEYRYYRFNTTATLTGTDLVQMSEFKFFSGTTRVSPVLPPTGDGSVTNGLGPDYSPENESPPNLIDNNTGTKWLHFGDGGADRSVIFDFGTGTIPVINSYTYVTAQGGGGEADRNPKSWTLEGSSDGSTWDLLDVRALNSSAIPTTGFTELTPAFVIPAAIAPVVTKFAVQPVVVVNGGTVEFEWETDFTDAITITPGGPPDLPTDGFVTLTPPVTSGQVTDTTYTLTADSDSAAPTTEQVKVRTVPGGAVTGQHVRFTPIYTQGGDIQLADIRFYKMVEGNEEEVIPDTCTYTDGSGGTGGETPDQMRDGNAGTKWYNGELRPVVFHFPATVSIESYRFTLGGDASGNPGRNPLKWTMEISDDQVSWYRIEDFTAFEYPMPAVDIAMISLPLPGYRTLIAPDIFAFSAKRDTTLPGDPIVFSWDSSGGTSVTITPGDGSNLPAIGTTEYVATADAVYTLTASNGAGTATKTLSFGVVDPPTGTIAYTDFSGAGDEIVKLDAAVLVNDSNVIEEPGDIVRLRLTPDENGKHGVAWFDQKIALGGGFDTTFGLQLTCNHREWGAEGLGFMIQNTPAGLTASPADNGPATNALTIKYSTWDNNGTFPIEARINLFNGATKIHSIDLSTFEGITHRGIAFDVETLTGSLESTPYLMRVAYVPGDLDLWVDGVQVLTDFNINLGDIGATDSSGSAYVGFVSQTGGYDQAADITSWTLSSTPLAPPLKLVSSTINAQAGTASFSWESIPGKEYRVTSSTTLTTWTTVLAQDIPATGALTSKSVNFTPATKVFFRIEEEP